MAVRWDRLKTFEKDRDNVRKHPHGSRPAMQQRQMYVKIAIKKMTPRTIPQTMRLRLPPPTRKRVRRS